MATEELLSIASLEATWANENLPIEEREVALGLLIEGYAVGTRGCGDAVGLAIRPEVFRAGRYAARQSHQDQDRADFPDHLWIQLMSPREGLLPRICLYSPLKGRFRTWVRSVAGKGWIDWLRVREETRQWPDEAEPSLPQGRGIGEMLNVPLAANDVAILSEFHVRDRIVLTVLAGIWLLLPFEVRERFVREYEQLEEVTLDRPFPPVDFLTLALPKERIDPLASLLGVTSGSISTRWTNNRHLLGELNRFQDFQFD